LTAPPIAPARRLLAAGMAALILAAALITFNLMLVALGGLLIIADPLEPAQVVVVLSGGSGDRIQEAARILQEKNASRLIITHPEPEPGGETTNLQRQEALNAGIPGGDILITGSHGNSTYAEALELRRFLEERGLVSALVVTDPFHSFRTRLIFREVFRGSGIDINVRPVRDHWYRSSTWWTTSEGWQATLSEYMKLFAYLGGIRRE
jgi:uncharacterized SAM-binding protein YcdF (DUF218 family)